MTQPILITLGLILLTMCIVTYRLAKQHKMSFGEELVGICAAALDQTVRKNANKQKVIALLQEKGESSNSDLREALGLTERTVTRYMEELERQGRVEQVGDTGRNVTYRLK